MGCICLDSKKAMQSKRTLAAIVLLVSCVLLAPAFATADTITTFDVSGQYRSPSSGTFSGTLTIDVTSGTATAIDITFPNLTTFDAITLSGVAEQDASAWGIFAANSAYPNRYALDLVFFTSPTTASLVGLTEGSINGDYASSLSSYVQGLIGSITPAVSVRPPVPEPSSLALITLGFLACLWFGFTRRRALKA
jgi:PEP-CTERM motif